MVNYLMEFKSPSQKTCYLFKEIKKKVTANLYSNELLIFNNKYI